MENKFKEVEFKYNGSDIKLEEFQSLMEDLVPKKVLETSSWDIYYTDKNDNFIRYRKSDTKPELTIKRKINEDNNQRRIEINLGLSPGNENDTVLEFVKLLDYKENFRIYKTCFIYFFEEVDVVFYIVYDENMNEKGRFVEIEYLEEIAHDKKTKHIFKELEKYESILKILGITKETRLKSSLFEMFKKQNV